MTKITLAAAAAVLFLAGPALADGMCGDHNPQTVQADTTTVVATATAPATDRK